MTNIHSIRTVAALVAGLGLLGAAQAQTAGSIVVRAGAMRIAPDVRSGNLSAPSLAGTQAGVSAANQIGGGMSYWYNDNVSFDIPLALPFKHKLVGAGAIASAGEIGTVKALPFTVLAQYHLFDAKAAFRPYFGAGLTYAKFFDSKSTSALTGLTGGTPSNPTTLKVDNKFTATVQMGATVPLQGNLSLDLAYTKSPLKTKTHLSTGQSMVINLDPSTYMLAIGYKF